MIKVLHSLDSWFFFWNYYRFHEQSSFQLEINSYNIFYDVFTTVCLFQEYLDLLDTNMKGK